MLLSLCLQGAVTQAGEGELRIAAYNVENMLDVFDDPYTEDEVTPVKPRKEIEAVARCIAALKADVVAISEVENEHILRAMANDFLGDQGYRYIAASGTNDGRGIRLGLLSKLPILSTTSHTFRRFTQPESDRQYTFARDCWQVKLQVTDTQVLNVYVLHLKSRRDSAGDPGSGKWRLAEAMEVRRIVEAEMEAHPGEWYVVAGDFNDTPDGAAVNHLLNAKHAGQPLLVDLHANIPPAQRITYLHEPYRSTIDYILACPPLAKRMIPKSNEIMSSQSLLGGSDHAPVAATFSLR